jgi:hypothetical protein
MDKSMNTETIPNLPEPLQIARKAVYQAGNYLVLMGWLN